MSVGMIIYVLLAALANVAGGFIIYIKKEWSARSMYALMALSAGLLLSIAVLDLIPEVVTESPYSPVFILIGMMILFFMQQFVSSHVHTGNVSNEHAHFKGTVTGSTLGMLIHTFFDGFSIAAGFELDLKIGVTVFVALLLHKIPDGVTISSIIYSLTGDRRKAVGSAVVMGISTVVGAAFAWVLTGVYFPDEGMLALALSLSAGIFLYVGGTDLLPAINAAHDRLLMWFVVLGIVVYFLLQWGISQIIGH